MRLYLASISIAILTTPISAAVVTVPFEGTVESSANPSISPGTAFSGAFDYESNTPANFSGVDFASYSLPPGNLSVTLAGLGITLTTAPVTIANVVENFGGDVGITFDVSPPTDHFFIAGGVGSNGIQSMLAIFVAGNVSLLSGTDLPSPFPQLSGFSGAELVLTDVQGRTIAGRIALQAIPEPGSILLVCAGLAGMACFSQKNRFWR